VPKLANDAISSGLMRNLGGKGQSSTASLSSEQTIEENASSTSKEALAEPVPINNDPFANDSANNPVSRSNTFHGRGRNAVRKSRITCHVWYSSQGMSIFEFAGLRKYTTISGIPEVDVRVRAVISDVDVPDAGSCEVLWAVT